jgi:hypothetical protein
MRPTVLEGLWDEIVAQHTELRGKRVRLVVLAEEPGLPKKPEAPALEPSNMAEVKAGENGGGALARPRSDAEWHALLNRLVARAVNANLPDEAVEREVIY